MKNIKNRIVQDPNRYKLVPVAGQNGVYDLERMPGTVTEAGTVIDRSLLMAMQGFEGQTTVFNPDGSITETNSAGDIQTTVFDPDGSITERFVSGGISIAKKTRFLTDGSIVEELI